MACKISRPGHCNQLRSGLAWLWLRPQLGHCKFLHCQWCICWEFDAVGKNGGAECGSDSFEVIIAAVRAAEKLTVQRLNKTMVLQIACE